MHQAKRPTANGDRRLLTVVQLLGAMPKLAMIWRLQDAEWRRERHAPERRGERRRHGTQRPGAVAPPAPAEGVPVRLRHH